MRCWKNSAPRPRPAWAWRSEEHTSELQSQSNIVCRLLLEKKKKQNTFSTPPHTLQRSERKQPSSSQPASAGLYSDAASNSNHGQIVIGTLNHMHDRPSVIP